MIMAYPGLFDGFSVATLPEAFKIKAHIFYGERIIEHVPFAVAH